MAELQVYRKRKSHELCFRTTLLLPRAGNYVNEPSLYYADLFTYKSKTSRFSPQRLWVSEVLLKREHWAEESIFFS
jgi:hypothetical protein